VASEVVVCAVDCDVCVEVDVLAVEHVAVLVFDLDCRGDLCLCSCNECEHC